MDYFKDKMVAPLSVNILYNKTSTFGVSKDAALIEKVLKKIQNGIQHPISKARLLDMREPHVHCDIQFHLEIPIFSAIPWSKTNIMLVNPEQWVYAFDSYVHAFDALLFRDSVSMEQFKEDFSKKGLRTDNLYVVPWCSDWNVSELSKQIYGKNGDLGFVCFLAGSTNKYEYLKELIPFWREGDPQLTVYTTRKDFEEGLVGVGLSSNITVKCVDLDVDSQKRISCLFRGHLICSRGEGFGYAAANSEAVGAFSIMNYLPVFAETFTEPYGVSWVSNSYSEKSEKVRYSLAGSGKNIRGELEVAFKTFSEIDFEDVRKFRQSLSQKRFESTCAVFTDIFKTLVGYISERKPWCKHYPPVVYSDDCPPISIITPTYSRSKLIEIAFHNLLATDYPHNKIEWIVVEDNETKDKMNTESIVSFQIQVPKIKLKYIPIEGRMSIGEKRNLGIENATHDIILFMDDDDHYPTTSFRRRVSWLLKGYKGNQAPGSAEIACCTTLALYDLKKGVSAVNVPPFDIPFSQRISEATLTFKKSAWLERKFPHVSVSEGEDWISGREDKVIEIPPQQIIVAFSHGANKSGRRIPPSENPPGCFWGFPKEYLIFIHKLAGVDVEIEGEKRNSKKK